MNPSLCVPYRPAPEFIFPSAVQADYSHHYSAVLETPVVVMPEKNRKGKL